MSSCDDMADINEFDDRDGVPDEDSCDSAFYANKKKFKNQEIFTN